MNSQKGFAHLILLFILFVALAAGYLYFTRSTNFFNNLSTSVIQPLKSAKLGLTLNNLSDGAVVEATSAWNRDTFENVISSLVTGMDGSYSSDYTAAKLAFGKALDATKREETLKLN